MDYIDYSSFPILTSTDCSPATDAFAYPTNFDKTYLGNPFTSSDGSLTAFDANFGPPLSSGEAATSLGAASSVDATTQLKPTLGSSFAPPTFDQLNLFPTGFRLDTTPDTSATTSTFDPSISPLSDHSRTSSFSGEALPDSFLVTSPPLSPAPALPSKREPTESTLQIENYPDPTSNPPKRKRGRPRLDRTTSSLSSGGSGGSAAKAQRTQRLPHNQVERKYREGLNASLERLRKTVPTLSQDDTELGALLSHPKPSKAMILEGAIEYIKEIEKERDLYRCEAERLRRLNRGWGAPSPTAAATAAATANGTAAGGGAGIMDP